MDNFKILLEKIRKRESFSDEEQRVLLSYLEQKDKEAEFRHVLSDHWDEISDRNDLELDEPDDLYYRIYHQIKSSDTNSKNHLITMATWFQKVAAILLLPLMVIAGLYFWPKGEQAELADNRIEIESPVDSRLRFFLPDGSSGWLRAGSRLSYISHEDGIRDARLEGAAFFEVAKNERQPFIVSTQDFKVKVLGTRFDVACFSEAEQSEVFLEEGKVEMLDVKNKRQTLLHPGQQYSFDRAKKSYLISEADADEKLAWINGVLLLRNRPLAEAVKEMEQFYHVDIVLKDKELEALPVYAKIENERLDEVMEYLTLILPIKYKIEDSRRQTDGSFIKRKVVIRRIN